MSDQRRYGRVPLGQPVEFAMKSDEELAVRMDGVAKDISLGGMFIVTDTPCAIDEEIVVYFTLPRSSRAMALPARVRWTNRDGMGVQLGLFGAHDTHEITEFIRNGVRDAG